MNPEFLTGRRDPVSHFIGAPARKPERIEFNCSYEIVIRFGDQGYVTELVEIANVVRIGYCLKSSQSTVP